MNLNIFATSKDWGGIQGLTVRESNMEKLDQKNVNVLYVYCTIHVIFSVHRALPNIEG